MTLKYILSGAAALSLTFALVATATEHPHKKPVPKIKPSTKTAKRVTSKTQESYADFTLIHAGKVLAVPGEPPLKTDGYLNDDEAEIIDLKNSFVLPGLIDSHVHLRGEWSPSVRLDNVTREDGDVAYDAADNARKTLMAGFTAVQDVGGPKEIFALRRAVKAGKVVGPHIRASGSAVSITGGHGDSHGYREDVLHTMASKTICDGPADCRRATRAAVKAGADVIKITATGGVLSNTNAGTAQQFFEDELEALARPRKWAAKLQLTPTVKTALKPH